MLTSLSSSTNCGVCQLKDDISNMTNTQEYVEDMYYFEVFGQLYLHIDMIGSKLLLIVDNENIRNT